MAEEHVPVALADAHTSVAERHVPAAIVRRSPGVRAKEVDQELLLTHHAVFPAMRPEASELRIGPEARQQIVRHRSDRVVSAEALVESLFAAHRYSPQVRLLTMPLFTVCVCSPSEAWE